eukprot:gene24475-10081_t
MSSSRLGTRESKNKTAVFKAVSQSRQAKEEKKKVPFSSLPKPKDSILGTGNAETRRQYLAAMVEDLTLQAKNASSDDDGSSSNNDFGRRARKQREPEYPDFEPSDGEMDEGFSFLTEPTTVERIEAALKRLRAAKIRGQAAAAFLSAGNDVLDFKVPDTDEDGDEGEDDDEPMQPMQPFNNKANRNLLRTNSSYLAVVEREKVMQAEREERAEKAKRNNAILASGGVVYDDDGSALVQEDDLERAYMTTTTAQSLSKRMTLSGYDNDDGSVLEQEEDLERAIFFLAPCLHLVMSSISRHRFATTMTALSLCTRRTLSVYDDDGSVLVQEDDLERAFLFFTLCLIYVCVCHFLAQVYDDDGSVLVQEDDLERAFFFFDRAVMQSLRMGLRRGGTSIKTSELDSFSTSATWFLQVHLPPGSFKYICHLVPSSTSATWFLQVHLPPGSFKYICHLVPSSTSATWFLQVHLPPGSFKYICHLVPSSTSATWFLQVHLPPGSFEYICHLVPSSSELSFSYAATNVAKTLLSTFFVLSFKSATTNVVTTLLSAFLVLSFKSAATSVATTLLSALLVLSFKSAATNVAQHFSALSCSVLQVCRHQCGQDTTQRSAFQGLTKRQTEDADGDASQAQAEAEALAEAQYLDKWTNTLMVFQAAVDDRMQVHSILDPEDGREPIPDEFIHLQPIVERRIKQCEDTGNNQLDLSLGITISCGDLGIVYKCLKGRESIHRIKASNNVLTPSGSLAMLDLIKAYPFKELNIVNNRGSLAMLDLIKAHPCKELNIVNNRGSLAMLDLIKAHPCKELNIVNNRGSLAMLDLIKAHPCKELNIVNNRGSLAMLDLIKAHPCKELNIVNNRGSLAMLDLIKAHPCKELNIVNNRGSLAMLDLIKAHPCKELNIVNNRGSLAMLDLIKAHPCKELNIVNNRGSLAMLDLIKAHPCKELNIVNNSSPHLDGLPRPNTLTRHLFTEHLDIGHCPIKDSGFQALMSSLQYNTQLRYLNVEHCGLTDLSLLHMDHALEDNTTITFSTLM